MKSLKLVNGDLKLGNVNEFEIIEGSEELAQSFTLLLEINLKEWFLNRNRGLDYNELQKKSYSKDSIRYAVIECLKQDDRFEELLSFDLQVHNSQANISFTARVNGINLNLSLQSEVN